jgi:hypothetical protein
MGFGDVDHSKLGDITEFFEHRLQFANLAKKGRSRVRSEDQYHWPIASGGSQVECFVASQRRQCECWCELACFQRAVIRALISTLIATLISALHSLLHLLLHLLATLGLVLPLRHGICGCQADSQHGNQNDRSGKGSEFHLTQAPV